MPRTARLLASLAAGSRGVALAIAATATTAATTATTATTAAGAGVARRPPAEERPVIVSVTGDAANGFDLTYADGGGSSPPTDSEARAECSEYDTVLARVRCRVEARTWYRDLGDLQRSLARADGSAR